MNMYQTDSVGQIFDNQVVSVFWPFISTWRLCSSSSSVKYSAGNFQSKYTSGFQGSQIPMRSDFGKYTVMKMLSLVSFFRLILTSSGGSQPRTAEGSKN
jgi:hypothetical protein